MNNAITIMGSAAAEGIPSRFCSCDLCAEARKRGGKDLRMTAAYSFNDRVRIDYGPDSYAEEVKLGLNAATLKHLFFTHEHTDHLDTFAFEMREPGFAHNFVVPLNIYGRATVLERLRRSIPESANQTLVPHLLRLFQPVELPEEDMTFYPLTANHYHIPEEAVFFAVRHGEAWILVANDTGIPPEETWQWFERMKIRFDVVIADASCGFHDCRDHHMGGKHILEFHDRLVKLGAADSKTRYVINHFSHNGGALHADLEARFNPLGIEVGFDGMVIPY